MASPHKRSSNDPQLELLTVLHMAGGGAVLMFGVVFWMLGMHVAAMVETVYGCIVLATLALLQLRPRSFEPVVWAHVILVSLVPLGVSLALGGLNEAGGFMIWGLIGPLAAMMFLGQRATWMAMVLFVFCLVLVAVLPVPSDAGWVSPPPAWMAPPLGVANIAGAGILCLATLAWFVRRLRFEQTWADGLLLGVLPPSVSRALRSRKLAEGPPRSVSLLIAEIADLDSLCRRLSVAETTDLLDALFMYFDDLAAGMGVERVRTTNDAFMVVTGLVEPNRHHAHDAALLALELRTAVASRAFAGHRVELRIGINSGVVLSGAVGRRRFIYEVWGRALSLAVRMEASGKPGCILLSKDSWELLKDQFRCRPTGLRTSRSSGHVEIFELLDRVGDPA